jgi:DNA-directed RNA polymerase specialized sigma24 family protein
MREPGPENGDFKRLMPESYRLVYQVAYSVLGNAADAEEVAQDTLLKAYRKFDSLRDAEDFGLGLPAPVGGWL